MLQRRRGGWGRPVQFFCCPNKRAHLCARVCVTTAAAASTAQVRFLQPPPSPSSLLLLVIPLRLSTIVTVVAAAATVEGHWRTIDVLNCVFQSLARIDRVFALPILLLITSFVLICAVLLSHCKLFIHPREG